MGEKHARSGLRSLLARHGVSARHRLGQNFLTDEGIVREIADAAGIQPDEIVVEIGPGAGALTKELARRAFFVAAIEIDERMLPVLKEVTGGFPNVVVIHGDALAVDFARVLAAVPEPERAPADAPTDASTRRFKVVANLPYYITTPILVRLVEEIPGWELAVLMVQKEVARRLAARPGSKAYGAITVLVQFHCEVEPVRDVPPEAFLPPPEVTSTVVRLRRRVKAPAVVADTGLFFRVVRAAFNQRRKMLKNALRAGCGDLAARAGGGEDPAAFWEDILATAGISPTERGENLGIEDFARIANAVKNRQREE